MKSEATELDRQVRELIGAMVSVLPVANEFATQLASLKAEGPITMLQLIVDADSPRSSASDGPLPFRAFATDDSGEYCGEFLIWVENGLLDVLEFAWVTDEPPPSLPRLDQLQIEAT